MMQIGKFVAVVGVALCAGATSAETFTYGSVDAPIESQTVTLDANTQVDGVTAYLKPGATLTLNGGPLVFAADAPLKVDYGRLVIDAPATLNGTLHVFYLLDRRHHGSGAGTGRHQFAHVSSPDLKTWTEHPLAVPSSKTSSCPC